MLLALSLLDLHMSIDFRHIRISVKWRRPAALKALSLLLVIASNRFFCLSLALTLLYRFSIVISRCLESAAFLNERWNLLLLILLLLLR